MAEFITKEELYNMLLNASKKYFQLVRKPCLVIYLGVRQIKIPIKPKNLPHLVGILNGDTPNEWGFVVDNFADDAHDLFFKIRNGEVRTQILDSLPKKLPKLSYVYKKVDAMTQIIEFFKNPNDIVLIEVDSVSLMYTNVLNDGVYRMFNFKLNIALTIDKNNRNTLYLKSCNKFDKGIISTSYIKGTKVFAVDELRIMKFVNKLNVNYDVVESNFSAFTNTSDYTFITDPYQEFSIEEIEEFENKE